MINIYKKTLAERARFELAIPVKVYVFSKHAHSATMRPLQKLFSEFRCSRNEDRKEIYLFEFDFFSIKSSTIFLASSSVF